MRDALRNAITLEESHRGTHRIIINCASQEDMRKIVDHLMLIKFGVAEAVPVDVGTSAEMGAV